MIKRIVVVADDCDVNVAVNALLRTGIDPRMIHTTSGCVSPDLSGMGVQDDIPTDMGVTECESTTVLVALPGGPQQHTCRKMSAL